MQLLLVLDHHMMVDVNGAAGSCPVYNPVTLSIVAMRISEALAKATATTGAQEPGLIFTRYTPMWFTANTQYDWLGGYSFFLGGYS